MRSLSASESDEPVLVRMIPWQPRSVLKFVKRLIRQTESKPCRASGLRKLCSVTAANRLCAARRDLDLGNLAGLLYQLLKEQACRVPVLTRKEDWAG